MIIYVGEGDFTSEAIPAKSPGTIPSRELHSPTESPAGKPPGPARMCVIPGKWQNEEILAGDSGSD